MLTQNYYGLFKICPNRQCRHAFDKTSHKGWMTKNVIEVFAVMKCNKCKDVFKFVQPISHAHSYFENLPEPNKANEPGFKPITLSEQRQVRRTMSDSNALGSLKDASIRPIE